MDVNFEEVRHSLFEEIEQLNEDEKRLKREQEELSKRRQKVLTLIEELRARLKGEAKPPEATRDTYKGMKLTLAIIKALRTVGAMTSSDLFTELRSGNMGFLRNDSKKDYNSMRVALYRLKDKGTAVCDDTNKKWTYIGK